MFLRGSNRRRKHFSNPAATIIKRLKLFIVYNKGIVKDFQPISRLIAFFQCYLKFINKIGTTCGIICLMNIRADTRPTTKKLIDDRGRFVSLK